MENTTRKKVWKESCKDRLGENGCLWRERTSDLNFVYVRCSHVLQPAPWGLTCLWLDSLCLIGSYCLTLHSSHNMIQSQRSLSHNKWRTDKVTFLALFSLINMFWLAEQSHRQTETCRISGASEWVTVSCIDRKWGLLWGQCIDFLTCQVWECREKSRFLLRRMPCQLSDSQQSLNC